jgi:hypothetical protein
MKGAFTLPEDIFAGDDAVAEMFAPGALRGAPAGKLRRADGRP